MKSTQERDKMTYADHCRANWKQAKEGIYTKREWHGDIRHNKKT